MAMSLLRRQVKYIHLPKWLRYVFSGPCLATMAFLVYMKTLAPGVYGFDSAELATGAYTLSIVHPPGYPLYLLIGKIFTYLPIRDVAYRLNIMSAFLGSLTVFLVFELALFLVKRTEVAWIAAALFAVSNYFWQMALVAEAYTMHTFFLALNLLLLLKWRSSGKDHFLLIFSLTYGFSLTTHTSAILFLPGYSWLIITSQYWSWRNSSRIARALALFIFGLTPYLYFPLRAAANPALNYSLAYYDVDLTTLHGIWWMISGQAYRFFAFSYALSQIPGEFARFFNLLWRNFLGVGVILGVIGLASLWRRNRSQAIGFLLIFSSNAIFFSNYGVMDKDTMFLPVYLIWALFITEGIAVIHLFANNAVDKGYLLNALRPSIRILLLSLVPISIIFNWQWVDMSNNNGPQLFAENVLGTADSHAMILAPWSSAVVLEYYQQVEGRRLDLIIHNRSRSGVAHFYDMWREGIPQDVIIQSINDQETKLVEREIRQRTVYIVEYDPLFAGEYEYLPEGDYFKLKPRE